MTEGLEALLTLALIGLALFLVAGGGVALYGLWYLRGRDPHTGLIADIVPQPPDALSPGAAGALLDEHADHCDVVAALIDLAHDGIIEITEMDARGRSRRGHDYRLTLTTESIDRPPIEAALVRVIFGNPPRAGAERRLSDVRRSFERDEPIVREALYAELVRRGYFRRSPAATRRRWTIFSLAGLIGSLLVGLLLSVIITPVILAPTIVMVLLWLIMVQLSKRMPQKTPAGAEASAKWRAFRRYLASIEKYERVSEAGAIFDRYLPYAVAFGLDKSWVAKFAAAGAAAPTWYHPDIPSAGGDLPEVGDILVAADLARLAGAAGELTRGDGPGLPNLPDISNLPSLPNLPDLQGTADLAGTSLQAASDGFAGLLDAAGSVFDAIDFDI